MTTTVPLAAAASASSAHADGVAGAGCSSWTATHGVGCDLGEVLDDRVAAVADDDDEVLGVERRGAAASTWPTRERPPISCRTFGSRRPHPGALARGEDDDGGRAAAAHAGSSAATAGHGED